MAAPGQGRAQLSELMFEAWDWAGRPAYASVAAGTSGTLIPLTAEEVEEFIGGRSVPSSSLQIEAFLSSLRNHAPPPRARPEPASAGNVDLYWQPIIDSWIAASGVPVKERATGAGLEGISNILDHVVEVATYLAAAGVGGIVGNRADAAAVKSAKGLFARVRERWLSREPAHDESLSRDEAADAARAAATAVGYPLESLTVRTAEQRDDGSWLLGLESRGPGSTEHLRVTIPPGDPGRAAIFVLPDFPHHVATDDSVPPSSTPSTNQRKTTRLLRRMLPTQFISRMLGQDTAWPRATRRWHCVYCGWKCVDRNNPIQCRSCGKARPLIAGSATMQLCLGCRKFSPALGSYCEWCGTALPDID